VYDGAWYSAFREDLAAYVASTQRYVTGTVRIKLRSGTCAVVGRRSPYSLYQPDLATYGTGDVFAHDAAKGFIQLWGLPLRVQAVAQPRTSIIKPAAKPVPA
jgi:argininosuccinate synthase